jgi:hypothetical protein
MDWIIPVLDCTSLFSIFATAIRDTLVIAGLGGQSHGPGFQDNQRRVDMIHESGASG